MSDFAQKCGDAALGSRFGKLAKNRGRKGKRGASQHSARSVVQSARPGRRTRDLTVATDKRDLWEPNRSVKS